MVFKGLQLNENHPMNTIIRRQDLVQLLMNTGTEVKIEEYLNALFNSIEAVN